MLVNVWALIMLVLGMSSDGQSGILLIATAIGLFLVAIVLSLIPATETGSPDDQLQVEDRRGQ